MSSIKLFFLIFIRGAKLGLEKKREEKTRQKQDRLDKHN
jgi:hypothetical protein